MLPNIKNFDDSKATCHDNIPIIVLKNMQLELAPILTKPFNHCLKAFRLLGKLSIYAVFKNTVKQLSVTSTKVIYFPSSNFNFIL